MSNIYTKGIILEDIMNCKHYFKSVNNFLDNQDDVVNLHSRIDGGNLYNCKNAIFGEMCFFYGVFEDTPYALMNGFIHERAIQIEITTSNVKTLDGVLNLLMNGPLLNAPRSGIRSISPLNRSC